MAGTTVLLLKIAFLAILWLFIVVIAVVVHSDLAGRRGSPARSADPVAEPPLRAQADPSRRTRKDPWVLAIDSGTLAGNRLQLVPNVRIGRSDACELVLDDDYASSVHARLHHTPDGWVLEDLGSTNGTYVNATRIAAPVAVAVDDIIRVGGVQMRLEV